VRVSAGTRLGPYEILAAVDAGGMGEVYRARDTRLGRIVAVKVLSARLIESPQARERFQREAQAVAALQHPNICTVHDVGETTDGHAFLVMELLQGETLRQRCGNRPFDVGSCIDIGIALADALDAAHRAGIVHRDIKPGNIFLTAHGPKILDFGLAKTDRRETEAPSIASTKSVPAPLTEPGETLGTVAYMSPEQLRGEPIDARSDLFSLGLVLYEMATGRPAFTGTTTAVIAAAILHAVPAPPRAIRPELPEALESLIVKAIDKDRALRYQHASDLRADLQRLKRDTASARLSAGITAPAARVRRPRWKIAVPAVAAVVALAGMAGHRYFRRPPTLTDKDTIVLADFRNATGDAVFDETLRQGLAVQLEQSPYLSLVSDLRIRATLGFMGKPAGTSLTPDIAVEICQRTGSAAVIEGSIAPIGTQYVLGLRASLCRTGDVLAEEQVQAGRKEDVLKALSQIAKTLRTRVGESLATIEQHSTPLEEATTSSLDALKAYSAARRIHATDGPMPALALFKRAVDIDPQFAMAFANMGLAYSELGEAALSAETTRRSYELRDRTSDPERFFIATLYDREVTGNLERELQTLTLWAQTYPRDARAHGFLAGFGTHGTGKYELCLEEASKAIALDPDTLSSYVNLVSCNMALGRIDQAERAWQRAANLHSSNPGLPVFGYHLAFLKGDRAGMDRQLAAGRSSPGVEELLSHMEALVLARAGRLESAARMSGRAIDLAEQNGHREIAAIYGGAVAAWNALFGDAAAARQHAATALRLSKGRDAEYAAGVALALAGDVTQSQLLAADLENRYPEDTSVRYSYLPTLRALVSLQSGQPSQAVEQLQIARTYELADPAISWFGFFGSFYPVYVRGEAYLAEGHATEAAGEFRKILDHRGILLGDPLGARVRLGLGRALAQAGDAVQARAAYQDLLALWKDADPDVPMLKQARAEYAKLQ
jgi:tetratricopeptide (TPR) repeat protein